MRGHVATFDEHRGLGQVAEADGRTVPFHCTAIADGTRTIARGTEVEFRLVNGPIGTREATDIRRVAA